MRLIKSCLVLIISLVVLPIILTSVAGAEEPIHPGYPYVFDMTGKLDRISKDQIVIDDVLCQISSSTTYHAHNLIITKATSFKIGDEIGVIFSDKGSREVASVWLIRQAE
ncbi:MAG: hypothetical protein MI862_17800 [Desulfobacterales bacterium]|nr:hypothetical protein [Desulfobacterales bacterium]